MAKKKTKPPKGKGWRNFIAFFRNENNQKVFGFLFILFALYFFISFTSFFFNLKEDFDKIQNQNWISVLTNSNIQIENSLGKIGALFSFLFVYNGFGIAAFFIPGFLLFSGIQLLGYKIISLKKYIRHAIWGLIWVPIFICYFFDSQIFAGVIGFNSTELLISLLGKIGTALLIIITFLIFITLRFNITPQKIIEFINKLKPEKSTTKPIKEIETTEDQTPKPLPTSNSEEKLKVKKVVLPTETSSTTKMEEKTKNDDDLNINIVESTEEEELDNSEIKDKLKELGEYDPTLELSSYKFPNVNLLNDYGSGEININKKELEENKQKIVDTLGNYNIGITSISATIGPTITLYEIVPEAGVRIAKIKNLEDDIALSLAAEGIRIIAPIPGKGTIGIEVPNQNPTTVSMSTVLKSDKFQNNNMDLPIAFGKTISNETFVVDLAKMPHLLMAGATGQGKSVGLNVILASLLYKKHPSQIKFVLVDPKKVELTLFNKIERHFLAKLPDTEEAIITDTKKVVNTVNSLCIEMDQRYELLKNAMCRNLKEYNAKFIARKLNPNEGHRYLPYIVLVIDEFADL
ncbi:MAG TPA: DNA translocase FtsK 4TM domain-containing protein, partial [Flavobacteriales bacterium]|nr:DNA translocase FtsK 4TM domain-containing protein [Flavobacteriales bacterium]